MVKKRARSQIAKIAKKEEIINIAEVLIQPQSGSLPTLAEIARDMGQVKTSLYIYFPTKEELYMEVLANGYRRWIQHITPALVSLNPSISEFSQRYSHFCLNNPKVLYLCSLQTSILESRIAYPAALKFKTAVAEAVKVLGEHTAKAFHISMNLAEELHLHTWALSVGLWGHCHPPEVVSEIYNLPQTSRLKLDYYSTLKSAIHALWKGTIKQ